MKILVWGTYDLSKPRARLLIQGLRSEAVDLQEIHADIWSDVADKSQMKRGGGLVRVLRALLSYPRLLGAFLKTPRPDVVLLGYPALLDVIVLWPFARARGVPIVMDLFISAYDTVVQDRGLVSAMNPIAWLLYVLEWIALRLASRVIIDTPTHARHIEEIYHLPPGCIGAVPVGAETSAFPQLAPQPPSDRPRILFYGQLIPLHGIETVLDAALSVEGRRFDWMIIGSGQDQPIVEQRLLDEPHDHISWQKWVPYEALRDEISQAHICLGVFGTSRKAGSVIPNKVYQCLAAGRPVVTRNSEAIAPLAAISKGAIEMVEPDEPDALLMGIARIVDADYPVFPRQAVESFSEKSIGQALLGEAKKVLPNR